MYMCRIFSQSFKANFDKFQKLLTKIQDTSIVQSTVWWLTPKYLHFELKIIEIAACFAAALFNEGYASILKVMHALQLEMGIYAKNFAHNSD